MKKKITTLFAIVLMAATGQAQWSLTGNAGINPATNFIGTTDAQPLLFRTNNFSSGIIDPSKYNAALGWRAFEYNTTGIYNAGFGTYALFWNNTGEYNTAMGTYSLMNNKASNNTAMGAFSMYFTDSGEYNTAVGHSALVLNKAGHYNTATGYGALYNTAAEGNSGFGTSALGKCENGWYNTAIGFLADFNTWASYSNSTAIGNQTIISASNQVRIGDNNVTSIGGIVDWTTLSDGRFKSNIQPNVPGLAFIKQLKPVTYTLNITALNKFLHPNGITDKDGKKIEIRGAGADIAASEKIVRTGFIAQDVATAAEKAGFDFDGVDKPKNETDVYGLRYAEFVTPLVQSVQELSNMNDSLKAQISDLKSQLTDLLQQVNNLKNSIVSTSINGTLPVLKQNSPNPFTNNTVISYYLPSTTKHAQLVVSSVKGQILKNIPLKSYGEGQVTISAGELAAGSYFYTLTVDGQRIDTRQMILTK
ncbi:T9SS type A sorting domain-containing protein [Niastella caeni]|uniref:T9SS type A sorting domain-containing protein n=1 Tax=Niastella caeni TaxID=2569763 RepID=A0A4S8I0K2_9BACT|nr:tail fiber domain-containing protein [Niastella caeni]THU41211.1 T9SS type A sorting domain-containing protein [Niastella caeni]